MTDEEAEHEAWIAWWEKTSAPDLCTPIHEMFMIGFRAGLEHARKDGERLLLETAARCTCGYFINTAPSGGPARHRDDCPVAQPLASHVREGK